jgi:putative flippase GtrA
MLIVHTEQALQKPFFTIKLDKFLAVIGATIVGMIVNFIGQKWWVFKETSATSFPEDTGKIR